jgi:hypothetical protein
VDEVREETGYLYCFEAPMEYEAFGFAFKKAPSVSNNYDH